MPTLGNPKHEAFCQAYINNHMNATEAYKQAGYSAEGASARRLGSKLLTNVDIKERVDELRKQTEKKALVTREEIARELNELRDLAKADNQLNVMAKAIELKGKMIGSFTDKQELTGADGGPLETDGKIRIEFVNSSISKED